MVELRVARRSAKTREASVSGHPATMSSSFTPMELHRKEGRCRPGRRRCGASSGGHVTEGVELRTANGGQRQFQGLGGVISPFRRHRPGNRRRLATADRSFSQANAIVCRDDQGVPRSVGACQRTSRQSNQSKAAPSTPSARAGSSSSPPPAAPLRPHRSAPDPVIDIGRNGAEGLGARRPRRHGG